MSDFDFIKWMLDESYLCTAPHHLTMIENKGDQHKPQQVTLRAFGQSVSNIALYRFDMEESGDFLPFFNDADGAPQRLNAFCDYIALIEQNAHLIIILFELKRGTTSGVDDQLKASYEFMRYILRSAERIKAINHVQDFKEENVEFRKVILRRCFSNKKTTKPKDLKRYNKDEMIKYDCGQTLCVNYFL